MLLLSSNRRHHLLFLLKKSHKNFIISSKFNGFWVGGSFVDAEDTLALIIKPIMDAVVGVLIMDLSDFSSDIKKALGEEQQNSSVQAVKLHDYTV